MLTVSLEMNRPRLNIMLHGTERNELSKLDVTIKQGEVRAIVGGTLPIVIDASTND
jgi:hypothetical protein